MWANSNNTQFHNLFVEQEVVKDKIQAQIENHVGSAGNSVTKYFLWNEMQKWKIEPIDYPYDQILDICKKMTHEKAAVLIFESKETILK